MGARGVYRGIFSALLDDPDFQALSPAARHTLLTLRLCSQNTAASIFRHYPEVTQAQTGYTVDILGTALEELERTGWIQRESGILWIRNGLKYDPSIRMNNTRHLENIRRAILGLPKSGLVARFCKYYNLRGLFKGDIESLVKRRKIPRDAELGQTSPASDSEKPNNPIPKQEAELGVGQGKAPGLSVGEVPRSARAPSEEDNGHRRMVQAILEARGKGELTEDEARVKLAALGVVQT